jgi:hypothetical protein
MSNARRFFSRRQWPNSDFLRTESYTLPVSLLLHLLQPDHRRLTCDALRPSVEPSEGTPLTFGSVSAILTHQLS